MGRAQVIFTAISASVLEQIAKLHLELQKTKQNSTPELCVWLEMSLTICRRKLMDFWITQMQAVKGATVHGPHLHRIQKKSLFAKSSKISTNCLMSKKWMH